ncbi:hypothetical protein L210DRAFT_3568235 [Boletus edulis BED1]|uniref:Uncharacterized protein n=1 Tax=Boletus edulis BED1 TaxID=1328754 RepID=A0AAD4BFD8_BOLED|nr:hypothetical protein L210DRAFT_3568235 [Boletus edulis BED1]
MRSGQRRGYECLYVLECLAKGLLSCLSWRECDDGTPSPTTKPFGRDHLSRPSPRMSIVHLFATNPRPWPPSDHDRTDRNFPLPPGPHQSHHRPLFPRRRHDRSNTRAR